MSIDTKRKTEMAYNISFEPFTKDPAEAARLIELNRALFNVAQRFDDYRYRLAVWTKECMEYADTLNMIIDDFYSELGTDLIDVRVSLWDGGEQVKSDEPHSVYFIEAKETGKVKIGMARHVERRLNELQTANGDILTVLGSIEFENRASALGFEKWLHEKYRWYRISAGKKRKTRIVI